MRSTRFGLGKASGSPNRLFLLFFVVLSCIGVVSATSHGHYSHEHLHHRSQRLSERETNGANQMVQDALEQIRAANKYRMENPRFNRYEFRNSTTESVSRRSLDTRATNFSTVEPKAVEAAYPIPPEVIKAAQVLAESRAQKGVDNSARVSMQQLKEKYWDHSNDTNTPEAATETFDGLLKRDSAVYWMQEMIMNGASPYASSDHKIFRNVMDYGAVGDGVADDTAAINLAISSGDRCGVDCGSSTVRPAVVYFPTGTYLVSSSIIQYYNTQLIGNSINRPTILAAASFVGLGVISSDVYVDGGDGAEWYINTNNFLRSIRNFLIDITNTDANAYVCGIHWQVAQGTDLQNIEFYMKKGTTQQGIYMENGSGGFLSDLTFSGGNFGAYLGNQQFTSRNLIFSNCNTALQIHWDWGWTMQGVSILDCDTGIIITGGAGGVNSNGQGVGSFLLVDSYMFDVTTGISTSLVADNSTSFVIQNTQFEDTATAVLDADKSAVLVAGSASGVVAIDSWGFGRVVSQNSTGSVFQNGGSVPGPARNGSLFTSSSRFFTRSAPTYDRIAAADMVNVKSYGAKGDGKTDDSAILNQVLDRAAKKGAVVFFPFGVYMVSDTLQVPVNSRIVGQAWSQIMGNGAKFKDQANPRPVVQVGLPGDAGIVEMSDLMFTVSDSTQGAVLLQWNVHEESQGSAALWNSHLRVGGAVGSNMQTTDCPADATTVASACIAASLMVHITPKGSAYIENMWVWTADHDLDTAAQEQVSVYTGRGVLIESAGPTWLWGSASEHSTLYQYNVVGAQDLFMGMIQTESPYFQPNPLAPNPYTAGAFPGDPLFADCESDPDMCAMAWGLRMVQSKNIYVYGAGVYSWFSDYNQDCIEDGCQQRIVSVEASSDIWLYNVASKGVLEMISPSGSDSPTLAKDNRNGYLSSIAAWLEGAGDGNTVGGRNFTGFTFFDDGSLDGSDLSSGCQDALYQTVYCDRTLWSMREPRYHGSLGDTDLTDSVCDAGCGRSLAQVHSSIETLCKDTPNIVLGLPAIAAVDRVWWAYNDTCFADPTTGKYCNDIIATYDLTEDISDLPENEMCSYCFTTKYQEMQKSAYSSYNDNSAEILETINSVCGTSSTTTPLDPIINPEVDNSTALTCISDTYYTTVAGDTCDSIASSNSVSAGTLYSINSRLIDCTNIPADLELCLPQTCTTAQVQTNDTCIDIAMQYATLWVNIVEWNGIIDYGCSNLVSPSPYWGKTICVSAPGDPYTVNVTAGSSIGQSPQPGYAADIVDPPTGADVAPYTTTNCGQWYTAGDFTCEQIALGYVVSAEQFLAYNPSLDAANCTASIQEGLTYCVLATPDWDYDDEEAVPWGEWSDASLDISLDGVCGFNTTCAGSTFGDCCGLTGVCGSNSTICAASNCNPYFGICDEDAATASTSAAAAASTAS